MLNLNDYVTMDNDNGELKINEGIGHYFFDPKSSDISDIETRLRMKYQDYFRAYFVDNKKQPEQLYDCLFKVDFT